MKIGYLIGMGGSFGMSYRTEWESNGIYWEYYGTVTFGEVAEAYAEFYSDHRSDAVRYQIFDGMKIEEIVGMETEVKMLAAVDLGASKTIRTMKVALVFRDDAFLPMAEEYISYSTAVRLKVVEHQLVVYC